MSIPFLSKKRKKRTKNFDQTVPELRVIVERIDNLKSSVRFQGGIFSILIVLCLTLIFHFNNSLSNRIDGIYKMTGENKREFSFQTARMSMAEVRVKKNPGMLSKIYLYSYDLSKKENLYDLTNLPEFINASYARWSKDFQKIVFISLKGSEGQGEINIYDVKDNSIIRLSEAGTDNMFPEFSPDGQAIAFSTRNLQKNRWDIAVFDILGKSIKPLTGLNQEEEFYGYNRNILPRWSPDGNQIIFCGVAEKDSSDGFFLFLMDKDGRNRTKTCKLGNVCDPSFSPNGEFVAFRTKMDNPYEDIWIAPLIKGKCLAEEHLNENEIKIILPGLVKVGDYYFKKLTGIGDDSTYASGHIDPSWISNEEIIYLSSDEYVRKSKEEQKWWDVKWSVKKINIFTGIVSDYPIVKGYYRNPQMKALLP